MLTPEPHEDPFVCATELAMRAALEGFRVYLELNAVAPVVWSDEIGQTTTNSGEAW